MPDRSRSFRVGLVAATAALAACAPQKTNTTYGVADIGRSATIDMGTIVSERPVIVQGGTTGVGTLAGAAMGGTAGSFIGRNDVRGNILGAIGGALIGGVVGSAVEAQASTGEAVEFIIREDAGDTISVVQTNELQLRPGERVAISRGARTRLARGAPGV